MRLAGNLTVFAWSQFVADGFDFVGNAALLHVVYRFAALPRVVLNRPVAHSTFAPVVTFAHEDAGGEAEFIAAHSWEFAGLDLPVICGENLDCGQWRANFSAASPALNGTTSVVDAACVEGSAGQQCFVIRFPPVASVTPRVSLTPVLTPTPPVSLTPVRTPSPTFSGTPTPESGLSGGAIAGIVIGSVAFAGIALAVVVLVVLPRCRRRFPGLDNRPLKSDVVSMKPEVEV
jgi:hypothetical protein